MFSLMANCFAWLKKKREPEKRITLVIIGVDNAGKTTTIASLQGEAPDGVTPTIGFANKEVNVGKFKVTIYDLGGGARFRDVWKKYYSDIFGVVFVVDSCSHEKLEESRTVLRQVVEHSRISGKPFLIFANKQDQDGALNKDEIIDQLELRELWDKHRFQYNVVPCSALKGYGRKIDKGIKTGLAWLLNTITDEFSKLSARVDHDSAIQKEEEEKEKKARLERIRKKREERERQEKEAGIEPAEESDNDDIVMGNPFQPIGKHVEKLKEKKKKSDKAKEAKVTDNIASSKDETPEIVHLEPIDNVKKKKKKKVIQHSDDVQDAPSINDVTTSSPLTEIEKGLTELSEDLLVEEKTKKKKKKPKKQNVREDVVSEYELNGISPENSARETPRKATKKQTTKYQDIENVEDLSINDSKASIIEVAPKSPRYSPRTSSDSPPFSMNSTSIFDNDINRKNRLDPIESSIEVDTGTTIDHRTKKVRSNKYTVNDEGEGPVNVANTDNKTKKKKKKKKKGNKTAPVFHEEENQVRNVLPAPSWNSKTPPAMRNSLPPIKSHDQAELSFGSSGSKESYQGMKLKEISSPPSWTRGKPNSDDNDVMT